MAEIDINDDIPIMDNSAGLWLLMGNYWFRRKYSFETLFGIRILPISPISSHFQVGLLETTSDINLIC